MITIKDVAKEAGVSVSTVSYVINEDSRISPETRKRVQEAIEKSGYNGRAGRKRQERDAIPANPNIVFYLHSVSGPVYSALIHTIKNIFDLSGFRLYLHVNDKLVENNWADGYIILNSRIPDRQLERLAASGAPVVLLDRLTDYPGPQHVLIDNEEGEYQLVNHLLQQGSRHFAYVDGVAGSYDAQMRFKGYARALSDHGLNADDMLFVRGNFSYNSGINAMKYFLSKGTLPDTIVCANDEMARGVLDTLKHTPSAFAKRPVVTGFDGYDITDQNAAFPTVAVDYDSWGSIAAYSIIEKLQNTAPITDTVFVPTQVRGI